MSFHNAAGQASGTSTVVATKSSLYTTDTKIRALQTLWDFKRLPEGEPEKRKLSLEGQNTSIVYCAEDASLNDDISHLHALARSGTYYDSIQSHIDGYLGAVAFARQNPTLPGLARQMVCNYMQSPQEGNLPDLCGMIRGMLDGNGERYAGSHAFISMFQALPCVKKPAKKILVPDKDYQLSINVLLGLLLGLYPSSLKFPPFVVRVNIYRRIHCLLTHGTGVQFCTSHPNLITLAYMEYCAHVTSSYMPAEFDILSKEQGISSFFKTCSLICDSFRQDTIVTGEEPWIAMDAACAPVVERHMRACKNRSRDKSNHHNLCLKIAAEQSKFYLSLPYVYPYAVHYEDSAHCIMAGEMKFLVSPCNPLGVYLEHAVAIQRLICAHPLPSNLQSVQMRSFARKAAVCERSALKGSQMHLCIPCLLKGPSSLKPNVMRGMCKLDVQSGNYMCSYCSNSEIVCLHTLGKVVCIRNHRYYYAPCCNAVQLYSARGDEFYETIQPGSLCVRVSCHHQKGRVLQRLVRHRCAICANVATQEAHSAIDHMTGELHTVYLCGRHTPNQFALKQAVNWEQLTEEIVKRDRPLFAITHAKRSLRY